MDDTTSTNPRVAAARKAARTRWDRVSDPDERRDATSHATGSRIRTADVHASLDVVLAELRALSDKVDRLSRAA